MKKNVYKKIHRAEEKKMVIDKRLYFIALALFAVLVYTTASYYKEFSLGIDEINSPTGYFGGVTGSSDYAGYVIFSVLGLIGIIAAFGIVRKMTAKPVKINQISLNMEDAHVTVDVIVEPEKKFKDRVVYKLKDKSGEMLAIGNSLLMPNKRYKLRATVRKDEELIYLKI